LTAKPGARPRPHDEIAASSKASTDRWRRIVISDDLAGWDAGGGFSAGGGAIDAQCERLSFCTWKGELEPHFRFDVKIAPSLSGEHSVVGVLYGVSDNAMHLVGFFAEQVLIAKIDEGLEHVGVLPTLPKEKLAGFVFGIERFDDHFDFYVDDKKVGTRKAEHDELAGGIGVFAQSASAKFSELRVKQ
jgi:hypothetical protein